MAQFGAKRPRFAPVATTPDNALPTYNFESVVTIGKLVAANLTVTNASGELFDLWELYLRDHGKRDKEGV